MAALDKPLLRIGPFEGFDATTAGPDTQLGMAASGSFNLDTERQVGAIVTSRGRSNVASFAGGGSFNYICPLNRTNGADQNVVGVTSSGGIVRYNIASGTASLITSGSTFTQAVQFGNILYTNGGQQIRPDSSYEAYYWNPTVNQVVEGGLALAASATSGTLVSGTYYYAFTNEVMYPDQGTQETVPGRTAFLPFSVNATIASGVSPSGIITLRPQNSEGMAANWYGTLSDGSIYTTNVYRQSTNQPTWYFVANISSASVVSAASGNWTDNNPDTTIAANVQLQFRYQNPTTNFLESGGNDYCPIFKHKERMWVFTLFEDPVLTSGVTQCQLWYSDAGIPWSFFADTQVVLVGDDSDNISVATATAIVNYSLTTNDQPMAGVSLSSVAILHKRRSTWILYGDDPSTFIARKMGLVGTVSSASVTVCSSNGDIDAWLSEDGPYLTDGNSMTYIGEAIREYINAIPLASWQQATGVYGNRTWFLSFPPSGSWAGATLRYYLPKGRWLTPLPYSTNTAYSIPSAPVPQSAAGTLHREEIIAAEAGELVVDYWDVQDGADTRGVTSVSGTWISPLTDSGSPGVRKEYQWVVVNAPIQSSGVVLDVTLQIDQSAAKTTTWQFDLSQGPTLVASVPPDNTGFMAQVTVNIASAPGTGTAAVLYSVEVHGAPFNNLVESTSGVTA